MLEALTCQSSSPISPEGAAEATVQSSQLSRAHMKSAPVLSRLSGASRDVSERLRPLKASRRDDAIRLPAVRATCPKGAGLGPNRMPHVKASEPMYVFALIGRGDRHTTGGTDPDALREAAPYGSHAAED
jgi:hypothetical protein